MPVSAPMKQLSEQCISGSRANLRGILIDRCQRLWGRSFRTHHDREANQFFHSGHFVIQSLRLRISSGLRTANHLCEGDDGDGDVWGAAAAWTQNSYNRHCLQTDSHYRSFSTKPSKGPLVHQLQGASVKDGLCEVWRRLGRWGSEITVKASKNSCIAIVLFLLHKWPN